MISIALEKSLLGNIEYIDKDVSSIIGDVEGYAYGEPYYCKGGSDYSRGELCHKGHEIDHIRRAIIIPNSSSILYFTGYGEGWDATLNIYDGEKSRMITEQVAMNRCIVLNENAVIMLTDCDSEQEKGNLEFFDGEKIRVLDSDVNMFLYPVVE